MKDIDHVNDNARIALIVEAVTLQETDRDYLLAGKHGEWIVRDAGPAEAGTIALMIWGSRHAAKEVQHVDKILVIGVEGAGQKKCIMRLPVVDRGDYYSVYVYSMHKHVVVGRTSKETLPELAKKLAEGGSRAFTHSIPTQLNLTDCDSCGAKVEKGELVVFARRLMTAELSPSAQVHARCLLKHIERYRELLDPIAGLYVSYDKAPESARKLRDRFMKFVRDVAPKLVSPRARRIQARKFIREIEAQEEVTKA